MAIWYISSPFGKFLVIWGIISRFGKGLQDFQTKNPNYGKFWRILQWRMKVYFMAIWSILRPLLYIL
jgi:hypothetical protein